MSLTSGLRLGPYEIVAPLGAGGMGEVYRAHDTKLDRAVAIKVLPDAVSHDAERLARFEREARVLASLNHPNIAQIYGMEESGETHALVMELVEGSTLTVPLPLETALDYAKQIAIALEAAHEKGIVHRDLKPGNVMVTPGGVVKVLDFGLAVPAVKEQSSEITRAMTMTLADSQPGMILGTAAYMSPEQAAGKVVDKRTDIWSYGVVLYEMITGVRLFQGETMSHTLAHVLTKPIELKPPSIVAPPAIQNLLARCMDRDVKTRLRDIGEARVAIEKYQADPAPKAIADATAPARRSMLPWIIAGLAAAIAVGTLAWRLFEPPPVRSPLMRFAIPLPPKLRVSQYDQMAVSPDGRTLAFTANPNNILATSQLWLRSIDSTEAHALPDVQGGAFPFWSPDSRFIGFYTMAGLKKVAVEGGAPVLLTKAQPIGGTWNRSGIILVGNAGGPILQIPEGGGEASPVLALDKSRLETSQVWPHFLPDGRHFLYLSRSGNGGGLYLAVLGSKEARRVEGVDQAAMFAQGHLFFPGAGHILFAQPFDPSTGKLSGNRMQIANDIGQFPQFAGSTFSVSESGVLAFRTSIESASMIQVFDRKGHGEGAVGPPGDYAQITLSPDEKRLAIDRRQDNSYDIWMLELARGVFSRVTFDPANERDPVFSPDGREIIFTSDRLGAPHMYRKTIGSDTETLIYRGPQREISEAWLKDGSILFGIFQGKKYFLLRPGEPGEPKLLYQSDYTLDEPAISPDGKWIAYGSTESGRWEAYVARFPQWDERKQISTETGMQPHWRRDGGEIVYITNQGQLMSVKVKTSGGFEVSSPDLLFSTELRPNGQVEQWTMTRDASKFYTITDVQKGDVPIIEVLNLLSQVQK